MVSNPGVNHGTLTPSRVTELLRENLQRPGHKRWVVDFGWPEALQISRIGIEGMLASFDRVLGARSENVVVLGGKA